MRAITVAELRQNPTQALADVEAGETYVVTRHRHPVAKLVPVGSESVPITPPRQPHGPTRLSERAPERLRRHEEIEALLAEMASDR